MGDKQNGTAYIVAGAAVGLVSVVMVAVSFFRLIWAMGGLAVALMRLAYLTVFDRPGRS
ncbi:hypothetical protein [Rhizorhabdus histidinilytica]|uniref:hypothetical protein n=1 Tax=Rhizorhabdus histidinilytica TaxID=439228 RepID=UPI00321FB786